MSSSRQSLSSGAVAPKGLITPAYRYFLNKLRQAKHLSNRDLARKMGTPDEILDGRERQLERFFLEGENPRAGFAKAVEEALGVSLPAVDYGFNPEVL